MAGSTPARPSALPTGHGGALGHSLIPLVNKLQDIFAQVGPSASVSLDLPQVAVVGSQSAGKSSVLEALVGRDFLPRGNEICTRRPLVLQLVKGNTSEEWGEFLHLPGERIFDFNRIRMEIEAETDREVGNKTAVSAKQIRLKIVSPHVLTMTLIDLPGITKVPVGGQPVDIELQIRNMVLYYIKHETCIILAVSSANNDLANSEALQLARHVDPDGRRTVGVITKLDIMDRGTTAVSLLKGEVIPLRLGYVGVVNRCQEDILNNKTIRDALISEDAFFKRLPAYADVASQCGTACLARLLNKLLVAHIRSVLPGLRRSLADQTTALGRELESLGQEHPEGRSSQAQFLLHALKRYATAFEAMIDGTAFAGEPPTRQLMGGARIHYIFQNIYVDCLAALEPGRTLSDDDIRTAIKNSAGPKANLLIADKPFELLVRAAISRLMEPSRQCARFVHDELTQISKRTLPADLLRYPKLPKRMEEAAVEFLARHAAPAETMINHLVACELAFINTSHPAFLGGYKAVAAAAAECNADRQRAEAAEAMQENTGPRGAATDDGVAAPPPGLVAERRAVLGDANAAAPRAPGRRSGAPGVSGTAESEFAHPPASPGLKAALSAVAGTSAARPKSGWARVTGFGTGTGGERRCFTDEADGVMLVGPPATLHADGPASEDERFEVLVTRKLLDSYYNIVRGNLQDMVPKAVMHFQVDAIKEGLSQHLIERLYREDQFDELLTEAADAADRRRRCIDGHAALRAATAALDALPLDSLEEAAPPAAAAEPTGAAPRTAPRAAYPAGTPARAYAKPVSLFP